MKKITVYDLDGVLNPLTARMTEAHVEESGFEDWEPFTLYRVDYPEIFRNAQPFVENFTIHYSKDQLETLRGLVTDDHRAMFLTDWGQEAKTIFCRKTRFDVDWESPDDFRPDGIFKDNQIVGSWWKHHLLTDILEEDPTRKVVFIDDSALLEGFRKNHYEVTKALIQRYPNLMIIVPNPHVGLSKDEIERFLHPSFFENKLFVNAVFN